MPWLKSLNLKKLIGPYDQWNQPPAVYQARLKCRTRQGCVCTALTPFYNNFCLLPERLYGGKGNIGQFRILFIEDNAAKVRTSGSFEWIKMDMICLRSYSILESRPTEKNKKIKNKKQKKEKPNDELWAMFSCVFSKIHRMKIMISKIFDSYTLLNSFFSHL